MNDIMRFFNDMKENDELSAKFETKIEEIKAASGLTDLFEIKIKAASALGYSITREQLDRFKAEAQVLSDDDLKKVGGGIILPYPSGDYIATEEKISESQRRAKEEPDCYIHYGCTWCFYVA